jgi:hypothetical protein
MSWYNLEEKGGRSGGGGDHSRVKELTKKAKAILEELCEEFEEMEEYFGERDEMFERGGGFGERGGYGERRRYRR